MKRNTRGRPPHDDVLTPAEFRVLHAVRHGLSNQAIADALGVSRDAIKYHIRNILEKTAAPNKKALRVFAQQPKTLAAGSKTLAAAGKTLAAAGKLQESAMTDTSALGAIGQISRTVSDIEASTNWYELVLELPRLYSFDKLAFFDCQGTRLMLSQAEKLNEHESILYFRVADIVAVHSRLQAKGVEFIAAPHRIHQHEDGTEEWMAFFKDPDARPLALMCQLKPAK